VGVNPRPQMSNGAACNNRHEVVLEGLCCWRRDRRSLSEGRSSPLDFELFDERIGLTLQYDPLLRPSLLGKRCLCLNLCAPPPYLCDESLDPGP